MKWQHLKLSLSLRKYSDAVDIYDQCLLEVGWSRASSFVSDEPLSK